MLKITVEMWPGGTGLRRRTIATADIDRIRNGALADYEVRLSEHPIGAIGVLAKIHSYPRWSASVWDLVARCIATSLNGGTEELPSRPTPPAIHVRADGVRYVRFDEIPEPAKTLFKQNIDNFDVPQEGCAHVQDWDDFLKGLRVR
jgi:hypothetical protein